MVSMGVASVTPPPPQPPGSWFPRFKKRHYFTVAASGVVLGAGGSTVYLRGRMDPKEASFHTTNVVLAGTMARTIAQVIIHPIDTVKTRLQVKIAEPPKKLLKWKKKIHGKAHTLPIKLRASGTTVKVPAYMYKGYKDLYRGVAAAFFGTIPTGILYWCAYETTSSVLRRVLPEDSPLTHLTSAASGAAVSSIVRVPGDTIRHQVQVYLHKHTWAATSKIWAARGWRGFYKGFLPTMLRDVPEIAIQFWVYETLRKLCMKNRQGKLRTWEHLVLGGVAGASAATCTMPLDFLKTRIQCGAANTSLPALIRNVVQEAGFRGLFIGVAPRVVQTASMSAAFFLLFEYFKLVLKPEREESDKNFTKKVTMKKRTKIWKRMLPGYAM